jgi:hypothetical protein
VLESVGVEGGSHRTDAAVHHVRGGDDVRSGARVRESCFCEERYGKVVGDVRAFSVEVGDSAMAVGHEFAEADVCDDYEIWDGGFYGANGTLDDSIVVIGLGGDFIFCGGDSEQEHGADAILVSGERLRDDFGFGELENARHAGYGNSRRDFFADEEWENEV